MIRVSTRGFAVFIQTNQSCCFCLLRLFWRNSGPRQGNVWKRTESANEESSYEETEIVRATLPVSVCITVRISALEVKTGSQTR